jgi:general secretion pathway protein M
MFESALEPLKQKWISFSKRDQNAIILLTIALILSILMFGIISPVNNAKSSAMAELANAKKTYNELVSLAPSAMSASQGTGSLDASSINSEVRRQAARNGIAVQRFEPDGENLKVWLEDSRYPSVIQWLGSLESTGITHLDLTIEDRPKPGFVSVRVTFGVAR